MTPAARGMTGLGPEIACAEAESALLGACLLAPEIAAGLLDGLDDGDFTEPSHRAVYGVIRRMLDRGEATDPVTVVTALRRVTPRIGDRDAGVVLAELMDAAITPAGGPTWRALVREHTWRRTVAEIGVRLDQAARTAEPDTLTDVLATAAAQLADGPDDVGIDADHARDHAVDERPWEVAA